MDLLAIWTANDHGIAESPRMWLCGPERRSWTFELPSGSVAVGVRFRPGYASLAFGLDASTMLDRRLSFEEIVGRADVDRAIERMVSAPDPTLARTRDPSSVASDLSCDLSCDLERLAMGLEDAIAERLPAIEPDDARFVDRMTDLLVRSPRPTQTELAAETGITPRHLHRRLQSVFGYGSATLARLLRFQRFLAVRACATDPTGASIAAMAIAAGYADQPHLARDCRSITGLTVSTFLGEYFPTFPDMSDPFKTAEPLVAMMQT
jgi:AraC-like DNA-binding protein